MKKKQKRKKTDEKQKLCKFTLISYVLISSPAGIALIA